MSVLGSVAFYIEITNQNGSSANQDADNAADNGFLRGLFFEIFFFNFLRVKSKNYMNCYLELSWLCEQGRAITPTMKPTMQELSVFFAFFFHFEDDFNGFQEHQKAIFGAPRASFEEGFEVVLR